ncbi:LOW QUALITY PROTEIN: hypothetical protein PanWU01x14_247060 [Parasponia andersonii]|uniref:Uncharacterized protein n=1 Tax=Parasponia andersonii TaxID=3476 RepID=A0A2P5BE72_PARAD|nr:LOW QUALITY PROTEIN: hypothetical protein PanWU01x14_247060 [Parasponia andersonii]
MSELTISDFVFPYRLHNSISTQAFECCMPLETQSPRSISSKISPSPVSTTPTKTFRYQCKTSTSSQPPPSFALSKKLVANVVPRARISPSTPVAATSVVDDADVELVTGVKFFESSDTMKLRVNYSLNASGHSGRSGIISLWDTDDVWNSVAVSLRTGVLYRATRGVRLAVVAGVVGGVLVGVAVMAKFLLVFVSMLRLHLELEF